MFEDTTAKTYPSVSKVRSIIMDIGKDSIDNANDMTVRVYIAL